ncbi:MAG: winged helix-turn-helix transcriptional regulator [Acetobacteraceae bacterium]
MIDDFNRKILRVLQKEGTISQRELSDRVGLSQNACWRRMQIMRDKGIIIGERVQLSREALGPRPHCVPPYQDAAAFRELA